MSDITRYVLQRPERDAELRMMPECSWWGGTRYVRAEDYDTLKAERDELATANLIWEQTEGPWKQQIQAARKLFDHIFWGHMIEAEGCKWMYQEISNWMHNNGGIVCPFPKNPNPDDVALSRSALAVSAQQVKHE